MNDDAIPAVGQQATKIMLEAVIAYAKGGRPIFPCRRKLPAISGGRGCLDATADIDTVTKWWGETYPGANVGLAMGMASSQSTLMNNDCRTYSFERLTNAAQMLWNNLGDQ